MEPVLTWQSAEIRYGGNPAVRGVSFSVRPGEILGIAGESGSGKSSLLKAAMGLLGPDGAVTGGKILFHGKNLPELPEAELRKIRGAGIGMVFQDAGASFCPVRTVGAQIYESLAAHRKITKKEAREKALALFEKLHLPDGPRIWDSCPFALSGGMNQRVGIAAAMLQEPEVLLADEPTGALDAAVRKQVIGEILRLREQYGTAVVLVTHDMGVVSAAADTVLVLKDGRTAEYGPAGKVLREPENPFTRRLLEAVPRLRREEEHPC